MKTPQEATEYCFECRTPLLSELEEYSRLCDMCRGVSPIEDTDHDRRNDEAAAAWQGQVEGLESHAKTLEAQLRLVNRQLDARDALTGELVGALRAGLRMSLSREQTYQPWHSRTRLALAKATGTHVRYGRM